MRNIKKRTNWMIIESINKALGFIKYEDKIKWGNPRKEELLRLEKAILELKAQSINKEKEDGRV